MKGLIPQDFIDEVLAKTDIVSFIDGYVPLKKQGVGYSACCPFHDEKTPSFNVIPKKQFYHCFGCGASGNVISFVMDYLNQEFPDAIETLAARVGLEVPREKGNTQRRVSLPLYELLEHVAQHYERILYHEQSPARAYLAKRGVSDTIAKKYQIGFAPNAFHHLEKVFGAHKEALVTTGMLVPKEDGSTYDRYRNRIIFPIHSHNGRLIGFGGRALTPDQKPKYLNSPETIIFQKNRELYGLHQLLEAHKKSPDFILIVEGYMDVIALAEHGLTNAVATLGTATSTYHIQRLARHTKNIVFCFDGDAAGMRAAFKALESTLPVMDGEIDAHFIFLPEGDDPDSLIRKEGKDAFLKHLQSAKPLHMYLLEILSEKLDILSLGGRSQLLKAVTPYFQKIPRGPYKTLLIDELSKLTHLEADRIENTLEGHSSPQSIPIKAQTSLKRTPLRLVTALVLQYPNLYLKHQETLPAPDALSDPNQQALKQILEHLIKHPENNTAQLLEAFRSTALFPALNKLAAWSHQVPKEALETEFIETFQFLVKQHISREIEALIQKARQTQLSDTEKQKLQDLLQHKHRVKES